MQGTSAFGGQLFIKRQDQTSKYTSYVYHDSNQRSQEQYYCRVNLWICYASEAGHTQEENLAAAEAFGLLIQQLDTEWVNSDENKNAKVRFRKESWKCLTSSLLFFIVMLAVGLVLFFMAYVVIP